MSTRHAVYIAAHEHPHQLAALVNSLAHDDIDMYIHIDAKSDQAPFEVAVDELGLPARRRPVFVAYEDRVAVYWGGFSQVRATLALLDTASTGTEYHRHTLLSGVDVALRPLSEILSAWSSNQQFMRIDRKLTGSGEEVGIGHLRSVGRTHFADSPLLCRLGLSGRLPRRVPSTIDLLQGSQWWSITDPALRWIRGFVDDNPRWMRFFARSLCSDEILFHSVLSASPYAGDIAHDYSGLAADEVPDMTVHGQHYIDWSDPQGVRPPELTEESFSRALDSAALFARKAGADWTTRIDTPSGETC